MGKRRHTVRSGTKALYKNASNKKNKAYSAEFDEDDSKDDMYNAVDRYHNRIEEEQFIRFDGEEQETDEIQVEGLTNVEGVMDLGLDVSDSEEDEYDDDNEEESVEEEPDEHVDDYDDEASDIASLKEKIEATKNNVLDWGQKKKDYYHGDTADLEIGQELEDAELEEEAGREVLQARLGRMEEADFYLYDHADRKQKKEVETGVNEAVMKIQPKHKKMDQMSSREKKRVLQKYHPELFPLVEHFRDTFIRPCTEETLIVQNALLENNDSIQTIGTTSTGLQYIITKTMMQTSAALNICQYLLLKADLANKANNSKDDTQFNFLNQDDGIQSHPVIERLNHLNILFKTLEESVENKIPDLKEQLDSLKKASHLMHKEGLLGHDDDDDDDDGEEEEQDLAEEEEEHMQLQNKDDFMDGLDDRQSNQSSSEEDENNREDRFYQKNEKEIKRQLLNEARFALRLHDDFEQKPRIKRRKMFEDDSEFVYGDQEDVNNSSEQVGKALALKLNTISQKMDRKQKTAKDPEDEDLDDHVLQKAFALMDEDIGPDSDPEDVDAQDKEYDENLDDVEGEGTGFYAEIQKKSTEKRKFKTNKYAVAPKYPRVDEEIEGERPVGRSIMKNRGLKPHRPKLNRNPRVKKREQYRKALIRRKGAVRDIRTGEGHKYGGEETGIKSGLTRSRKLGVK